MKLTQIRNYINTRMAVVASGLDEWKDSLSDIQNIPSVELDDSYHIEIGAIASTPQQDRSVQDQATVTISLFKLAYNDQLGTRDSLLDVAHDIRCDLINQATVGEYLQTNDGNIQAVEVTSITPSEFALSNDNIIKVELELNVRLYFILT